MVSASERFWAKVDKSGECWEWTGTRSRGYGHVRRGDGNGGARTYAAHRYVLILLGNDPGDMLVDHICHNRACVRPEHLRLVTNKQNQENRTGAQANSASGVRGVSYEARDKTWRATVKHHGERHTKRFRTIEEATDWAVATRLSLFTHSDADRRAS